MPTMESKKLALLYLISSLSKTVLLFFIILLGDYISEINFSIKLLVYFIVFGAVDWVQLNKLKAIIEKLTYLKALLLCYSSFVPVLFLTGPLFLIYNKIFSITYESEVTLEIGSMIIFLILGLVISIASSTGWYLKNKNSLA